MKCAECGREFEKHGRQKYCSKDCYKQAHRRLVRSAEYYLQKKYRRCDKHITIAEARRMLHEVC